MSYPLKRKVERETAATAFSRSHQRNICVILEPPGQIGFRLKGARETFWLSVSSCFHQAVFAQVAWLDRQKREAKKLGRKHGLPAGRIMRLVQRGRITAAEATKVLLREG